MSAKTTYELASAMIHASIHMKQIALTAIFGEGKQF